MGARRGKGSLCPPDCVLYVDIVAKHLGRLDALAERAAPRRFSAVVPISVSIAWRAIPSAVAGPFVMNMNGNA